jgi:hypothetical protein
MNNLNHVIEDLESLSQTYSRRLFENEIDDEANPYLSAQAHRFYVAAQALRDACSAAHDRAVGSNV